MRLVLARISPMIWRRLMISSATSIAQKIFRHGFRQDLLRIHCVRLAAGL
jgi:hypothetical protein